MRLGAGCGLCMGCDTGGLPGSCICLCGQRQSWVWSVPGVSGEQDAQLCAGERFLELLSDGDENCFIGALPFSSCCVSAVALDLDCDFFPSHSRCIPQENI